MISVYNAEKKELMAIFASTSMAASYIFGHFDAQARERLQKRICDKFRISDSRFSHPVAARHSPAKHIKLLADNHGLIFEGYREVKMMNIGGMKYTKFVNEKTHESIP